MTSPPHTLFFVPPTRKERRRDEEKFMKYKEFERIISAKRMGRYLEARGGDTRKAMTLYRYLMDDCYKPYYATRSVPAFVSTYL